jgi:hypothetical protein
MTYFFDCATSTLEPQFLVESLVASMISILIIGIVAAVVGAVAAVAFVWHLLVRRE